MSTKSTIAHGRDWHIYTELAEQFPNNVCIQKRDHCGNSTTVTIPWEGAVALANHLLEMEEHNNNLKDPVWLQNEISYAQSKLDMLTSPEHVAGVMDEFAIISAESTILKYSARLESLENPLSYWSNFTVSVNDTTDLAKLIKAASKREDLVFQSTKLVVDIYLCEFYGSQPTEKHVKYLRKKVSSVYWHED